MGNVGGGEILLILVVALMVLGPTKLPEAMRQVGRAVGEVKRLSQGFQAELKAATDFSDDEIESRAREAGRQATGSTVTGAAALSTTSPLPASTPTPPTPARPRQVVGPDPDPDPAAAAADPVAAVDGPVPTVADEPAASVTTEVDPGPAGADPDRPAPAEAEAADTPPRPTDTIDTAEPGEAPRNVLHPAE